MKTISKQYQKAGNIALVQVETLAGEGFGFLPAAPAIDKGIVVIREVRHQGAVNTLLAINKADNYFLLTDMDLLKGAKQNRVVNTSVLLAPKSKREVDVTCVERSRWHYDSPTFKTGPRTMESKMRAAKATSLKSDMKHKVAATQSNIWNLINKDLVSKKVRSSTEDYNSILDSEEKERKTKHRFSYQKNCNGLAVFDGIRLVSFDLFGNREAYRYYFDKLEYDALGRLNDGAGNKAMDKAEAFYWLDEFLDNFETQLETPGEQKNESLGELRWSGDDKYPGFGLSFNEHLIHMAGFARE